MRSVGSRQRLQILAQADLGAAAQIMTGEEMWSKQREIARAVSRPRSKVAVPSCNASGKTWLAARIAAAFYEAYTPGTPCIQCDPTGTKGGCRGCKVITTSSKEEHLRDNLWGELRTVRTKCAERGRPLPGRYLEGDLRIVESESNHFITGQSANTSEGMQGYHAAHKLIIGDEATSVDEEVKLAIMRLLATADARLLLIYNPTTPDTYAAQQARSPRVETIRITAWDTPYFTNEHVPEGANLITPEFLEDLKASGDGPGTFVWHTSIEAKDWDLGDDLLIPGPWFDRNLVDLPILGATRQMGVDMASYGSDENVIAVRDGDFLVELAHYPSMRMDVYWDTHVTKMARIHQPHFLAYDADGVGAGVTSDAEKVRKYIDPAGEIMPFRGGIHVGARYFNARSAWYWMLRKRFENDQIKIAVKDDKLRDQLTDIHYTVTPKGEIRVETKQEMRKRGVTSPDRADGVMYSFALSETLLMPEAKQESMAEEVFGVKDHSEKAMWERDLEKLRGERRELHPVFGVSDDW